MSRVPLSLTVPDLSGFARAVGASLQARAAQGKPLPGHVELLNLMARALGARNLQALQAAPPPEVAAPLPLTTTAQRALALFDAHGRLSQWPAKRSVQRLCMWLLWIRFDADRPYTEAEVNTVLKAANAFGDHVTLRRELINDGLMTRTPDCRVYRKLPRRADDEARALMQAWRSSRRT